MQLVMTPLLVEWQPGPPWHQLTAARQALCVAQHPFISNKAARQEQDASKEAPLQDVGHGACCILLQCEHTWKDCRIERVSMQASRCRYGGLQGCVIGGQQWTLHHVIHVQLHLSLGLHAASGKT